MTQIYTIYRFIVIFLRKKNKILLIYHTLRQVVCKNIHLIQSMTPRFIHQI